jgi:hypothetical protein
MTDANDLAFIREATSRRIVREIPAPRGGNAVINPHVSRFVFDDGGCADLFHVKPVYYETKRGNWRPLSEISVHHGNKKIILMPSSVERMSWRFMFWLMKRQRLLGSALRFGLPRGHYAGMQPHDLVRMQYLNTFYPDPNPETTCCDGGAQWTPAPTGSWATAHAALAGTTASASETSLSVYSRLNATSSATINRAFALFDTSTMVDAVSIQAATVSCKGLSKINTDNDGDDWVNVVQTSPASNTDITTADYDQCGAVTNPTEGATRIDLGSISASAYNTWTLDATGRGWISKTGITKLGWREGHDAIDSTPAVDTQNFFSFSSADTSGTASDPKLLVYSDGHGGCVAGGA